MFKEMRRKDKELKVDGINEVLLKGKFGVLSTISPNGYPYGVPLNYVYKNGLIYFHCAKSGLKTDSIMKNNKVSFCVSEDIQIIPDKFSTKYKSVILYGTAAESEGEEKKEGLMALIEKYSPDFLEEGKNYIDRAISTVSVYKIEINHITGKAQV